MTKQFVILCASIAALACFMSPKAKAADDFCASSPIELLSALDGTWTLSQGAGMASSGLAVPLPPSSSSVNIVFDPSTGSARMSGSGEEITMFPSSIEQAENLITLLTDEDTKKLIKPGEGCDWYSLPVVLGGKPYDLSGYVDIPDYTNLIWGQAFGKMVMYCMTGFEGSDEYIKVMDTDGIGKDKRVLGGTRNEDEMCNEKEITIADIPPPTEGEMIMSLLIKFQSLNAGSGVIHFEGQLDGYSFEASAPITLTR